MRAVSFVAILPGAAAMHLRGRSPARVLSRMAQPQRLVMLAICCAASSPGIARSEPMTPEVAALVNAQMEKINPDCPVGLGLQVNDAGRLECQPCPLGTYNPIPQVGYPGDDADGFGGPRSPDNVCMRCPNGYERVGDDEKCIRCASHMVKVVGQQADDDCVACPAGTIPTDDETCELCGAGQEPASTDKRNWSEWSFDGRRDNKQLSCVPCPKNAAKAAGGIQCEACVAPQVPSDDRASCANCPPGRGFDDATQTCVGCTAGSRSVDGRCAPCPQGTTSHSRQSACMPCVIQDADRSVCTPPVCPRPWRRVVEGGLDRCVPPCSPGQYAQIAGGVIACQQCLKGSACDGAEMIGCDGGTFSDSVGLSHCKLCPAGSFSFRGTPNDTCRACPDGRSTPGHAWSEGDGAYCPACPAQTVRLKDRDPATRLQVTQCVACGDGQRIIADQCHAPPPPGRYYDERSDRPVAECPAGKVCPGGWGDPAPCGPGMTSPRGAKAQDDCVPCPRGFELNGGSCQKCEWYHFSSGGEGRCQFCPPGQSPDVDQGGCQDNEDSRIRILEVTARPDKCLTFTAASGLALENCSDPESQQFELQMVAPVATVQLARKPKSFNDVYLVHLRHVPTDKCLLKSTKQLGDCANALLLSHGATPKAAKSQALFEVTGVSTRPKTAGTPHTFRRCLDVDDYAMTKRVSLHNCSKTIGLQWKARVRDQAGNLVKP